MQIIPVASGKGGVGKSLIATNLAIALGQAGKNVVIADCDLGGSNLHLMFGMQGVGKGIGHFVSHTGTSLAGLVTETRYQGVRLIPGDNEIPGIANLSAPGKKRLITGLRRLECDYLILDLGAGSGQNVIDLFLTSHRGLVIASPTVTSALNAYLFLKTALFRVLSSLVKKNSGAARILSGREKPARPERAYNLLELLKRIKTADRKVYDAYREHTGTFVPRLILNLLENEKDASFADRIRRSLHEYLGLELQHLG
ncbi:MAG TPA: MinD/ParA family protein, partial [Spirochaetia bacterium]|nr:MinD/ParA family protein [Spirochaetia bacterium]